MHHSTGLQAPVIDLNYEEADHYLVRFRQLFVSRMDLKDLLEPVGEGGVGPRHEVLRQRHVVREHHELLDEVIAQRNLEKVVPFEFHRTLRFISLK